MTSTLILPILAFLSLALTLWQWLAARRFPLHRRVQNTSFAPAVTVLKPLKGCDAETKRCLQSWLEQDYGGPVQILFGVASVDDPVCGIVRELLPDHPKADAQLVLCAQSFGANAKVSTLIQLERQATHDVLIVSDADVRAPGDLLTNLTASLLEPEVGLVNCFYRLANPATPAMQWEAIAINADFWSQVLQAQGLKPLDFALGAVMAVKREALKKIGGFAPLADCLADDYQLGNRIARAGWRIKLCPVVVECWETLKTWRQVWQHQLRWARTIRVCRPLPYFLSILSNATLWPLLWLATSPSLEVLNWFMICIFSRMLTAVLNQTRLAGIPFEDSHKLILPMLRVPIKDMFNVAIWVMAFIGNNVEWRGRRYRVLPGGKLVKS